MRNTPILALLALTSAILVSLTGCLETLSSETYTQGPLTETAAFTAGQRVKITNQVGNVTVESGDVTEVTVTYTKQVHIAYLPGQSARDPQPYFDGTTVTATTDVEGVVIDGAIPPDASRDLVSVAIDMTITLPREAGLELDIDVGNVDVADVLGAFIIDIDVGFAAVEYAEAPSAEAGLNVHIDVGDIEVSLPATSAFVIDAETEIGAIDTGDFAITVSDNSIIGDHAQGEVGSGGPALALSIGTGNITLNAL